MTKFLFDALNDGAKLIVLHRRIRIAVSAPQK
jgi:hypothetical protein